MAHSPHHDHLDRLLPADVQEFWFRSFARAVREIIHPPQLPPLEVTSKPVPVKDIWGQYGRQKKSWVMSTAFQSAAVLLLLVGTSSQTIRNTFKERTILVAPVDISAYKPDGKPKSGGRGGGDRSPLPSSQGQLPKPAPKQFTPPQQVLAKLNPALPVEPTIVAPPDAALPQIKMDWLGDPLARPGPRSNGTGSGGGIGENDGTGIGSGLGPGYGPGDRDGTGLGVYNPGHGITAPVLLTKVDPEYSEEARKAKYQGTVILYVEVDPSGHTANPRVVRSLGLGLDDKAIEAVRKWRFRPGKKDGRAVTVAATVEVNFRLL